MDTSKKIEKKETIMPHEKTEALKGTFIILESIGLEFKSFMCKSGLLDRNAITLFSCSNIVR